VGIPPDPGRRLGERILVGDVFLRWRLDEVVTTRFRTRPRDPSVARLLDVSVSGARVVAAAATDLRRGSVVLVELGDARAVLRIRWIENFGDEEWRTYGTEFVSMDHTFRDWINHLLDGQRPHVLVDAWNDAI
jgi:hypothetical protein